MDWMRRVWRRLKFALEGVDRPAVLGRLHHVEHADGRAAGHHRHAQVRADRPVAEVATVEPVARVGDDVDLTPPERPAVLGPEDLLAAGRRSPGRDRLHQVPLIEHAEDARLGREQLLDILGDRALGLLGGEAGLEQVAHVVEQVRLVVAALEVADPGTQLLVGLAQLVLHLAPLGDVGEGDHRTTVETLVDDRVARVLDREGATVRPLEDLLHDCRRDAVDKRAMDRTLLQRVGRTVGTAVQVRELVDVLADEVRGVVAEHPGGGPVDEGACAMGIDAVDPLARRLEDQPHRVGYVLMGLQKDHVRHSLN